MRIDGPLGPWVCPECQEPLQPAADETLACPRCARSFASTLGMPVFYPEHAGSRERLGKVLDAFDGASWIELLPHLHPKGRVPEDPERARRWADERIRRHDS